MDARLGRCVGRVASSGACYAVFTTSRADRDLRKLSAVARRRVEDALFVLGDEPYTSNAAKLQGRDGYRLRVGDYRLLYLVDDLEREVTVFRIAHRREAYH